MSFYSYDFTFSLNICTIQNMFFNSHHTRIVESVLKVKYVFLTSFSIDLCFDCRFHRAERRLPKNPNKFF